MFERKSIKAKSRRSISRVTRAIESEARSYYGVSRKFSPFHRDSLSRTRRTTSNPVESANFYLILISIPPPIFSSATYFADFSRYNEMRDHCDPPATLSHEQFVKHPRVNSPVCPASAIRSSHRHTSRSPSNYSSQSAGPSVRG